MSKPKYKMGDRIADSHFTVCGLLTLSNGMHRYFLQCGDSDNTFVGTEEDVEDLIDFILDEIACRHLP
jgi:hypothetical protein